MPLHDWSKPEGWAEVHAYWLVWLAEYLKPRLPAGYRAHIGILPTLTIGSDDSEPDVGVVGPVRPAAGAAPVAEADTSADPIEPDYEAEVAVLDTPDLSLLVETRGGRLVAAIELISRRNKDRPAARASYAAKYFGYLHQLVNLMIVDVLPRPQRYSFADEIAQRLGWAEWGPQPAPVAVSFRVDGRMPKFPPRVSVWRRPLAAGQPLPTLPLAITPEQTVLIDLEESYTKAAQSSYRG